MWPLDSDHRHLDLVDSFRFATTRLLPLTITQGITSCGIRVDDPSSRSPRLASPRLASIRFVSLRNGTAAPAPSAAAAPASSSAPRGLPVFGAGGSTGGRSGVRPSPPPSGRSERRARASFVAAHSHRAACCLSNVHCQYRCLCNQRACGDPSMQLFFHGNR
jgi:hypothetical protein